MSRHHLLPDAGPVLDVEQAVYVASRDYKGGQTGLSYAIVIDAGTFQKKVSIANTTHHLTLREFLAVADATDDPRIDEAYARRRGKLLFTPQPVPATPKAMKALAKMMHAEGDFIAALHDGLDDGFWTEREVAELDHHGYRLIGKILGIMAGARLSLEGRCDG